MLPLRYVAALQQIKGFSGTAQLVKNDGNPVCVGTDYAPFLASRNKTIYCGNIIEMQN